MPLRQRRSVVPHEVGAAHIHIVHLTVHRSGFTLKGHRYLSEPAAASHGMLGAVVICLRANTEIVEAVVV
jgi:hypothetical protein